MEHKTQKPMNRLEEIRRREKKATPGPWMEKETDGYAEIHNTDTWGKQFQPIALVAYKENADFIAHAREDIPWLLGRDASAQVSIGQMEARVKELEEQLAAAPCWCNDCVFGRIYEEHGIGCFNTDSEHNGEWVGTYDSCEQCSRRGPKEGI